MDAVLEMRGATASYGMVAALRGVDLEVGRGEVVALIGRNGAGKTTTLKVILGLLATTGGTVSFDGEAVNARRADLQIRRGMAVVPEGRRVFAGMDVVENLRMGGLRAGRGELDRRLTGVYELFPRLAERRDQVAGTLSGGEQQMLAIGRALMAEPQVLLLDEPSLGLAPVIVRDIFRTIRRIATSGVSILLVEQNAKLALGLAQRAYVLETGRVVASGPSAEIADSADLRQAYFGGRDGADGAP